MNIKNRLIKLEALTHVGETFCACPDVSTFELYRANLGADSDDPSPHLMREDGAVPDICSHCRKPIAKQQIVLQFVDHTTKTRFPKKWAKPESSKR